MKKQMLKHILVTGLLINPIMAFAVEFGVVDAAKVFSKYNETQKTKRVLESHKEKLQKELEAKKAVVQKLDEEYVAIAKKIQELRDSKKEAEASKLEPSLKELRTKLAKKSGELEKFFKESQQKLYEMEEKEMGALSKTLDEKVDKIIKQIATKHKIKAVFEKRFFYYGDENVVKDITEEVLEALNKSK